MNDVGGKEQRFLDALESLFTGAQVDGQSGFINLMRLKRRYFQSLRPQLLAAIDQRARPQTAAREELFDKLYTFFGRYFCESGSIYFRHLPAFAQTYQQVYADGQDVALSWKTQDLYYVKSDTLIRSMPITLEHPTRPDKNLRFYFDASQLQHKQNNEKREILFQFQQTKQSADGPVLHLEVHSSQKGRKTNIESILKQARKAQPRIRLSEEQLQKACRIFRRQTEADFFIHKDARGFLREQFDLWMYQYLFRQETIFQEKRLQRSFTETKKFDEDIRKEIENAQKPLVFMDGKSDIEYLKKAAEFLGQKELLQGVELRDGGGFPNLDKIEKGKSMLDKIWKSITPQLSEVIPQKIILLYDCDRPNNTIEGNLFKRNIPEQKNHLLKKGIENLFEKKTLEEAREFKPAFLDIEEEHKRTVRGQKESVLEEWTVNKDEKTNLCDWLCKYGTKEDFKHFQVIFDLLEEILES